jgi:AAA family ATP:ADP antiporter
VSGSDSPEIALTLKREKRDIGTIFLLFLFFFMVISCFWSLKPLRSSSVVKAFGPEYYPLFKQGFLLVVPIILAVYSMASCYLSRAWIVYFFSSFFTVLTVAFWFIFKWAPSAWSKMAFFFYIDGYITVMVAIFWTYMNDTFESDEAKKLYGIIGSGGILGGITGSAISGNASVALGPDIILVASVFLVSIIAITYLLEKKRKIDPVQSKINTGAVCPHEDKKVSTVLTEGISLVMKGRYLIYVVAIVGIYEIVSTVVDYQFNASSSAAFEGVAQMAQFQGQVFFYANIAAFFVMALLTPFIHRKCGIMIGLLFLPVALLLGSIGYYVQPILAVSAIMIGAEAAFAYSINQASKEILYVPLDRISKYKGKAFIDMFVFRAGKALGAAMVLSYSLWLVHNGFTHRLLMGMSIILIIIWLLAVVMAGRAFKARSQCAIDPEAQKEEFHNAKDQ